MPPRQFRAGGAARLLRTQWFLRARLRYSRPVHDGPGFGLPHSGLGLLHSGLGLRLFGLGLRFHARLRARAADGDVERTRHEPGSGPKRFRREQRAAKVKAEELVGAVLVRGSQAAPRQQRGTKQGGENIFQDHGRPPEIRGKSGNALHLGSRPAQCQPMLPTRLPTLRFPSQNSCDVVFRLARRRSPYSLDITSFSDSDASIAAIMMAAIAVRPMTYEPENSFNQPIMEGPAKPPIVPMLLMKASPPAAAAPVKKRVGMVQKIARAAVTPTSAALKPTRAIVSEPDMIGATRPAPPSKHAIARFTMRRPLRST